MPPVPSLFAIGSCRILTPLRRLEKDERVALRHNDVAWLTHSTKDTIQKILITLGRLAVQEEQKVFLSPELEKNTPERAHPAQIEMADCIVIEISSLKNMSFRGFELQQWYWQTLVCDSGIDLKQFTQAISERPERRCLNFLRPETPQIVRDLAREAIYHIQNRDDLLADLRVIDQHLQKPIIFVPHMDVTIEDGGYVVERRVITPTLKEYCEQSGHICFDPVPFINAYGLRKAIIDLGHYTPEFIPVLTERLYEAIQERVGMVSR